METVGDTNVKEPNPNLPQQFDGGENFVTADGKNKCSIHCPDCQSLILCREDGRLEEKECQIPRRRLGTSGQVEWETCSRFWTVAQIMDFANVGFSNSADGVVYLVCADCEVGPLGFKDTTSNISYLAVDRVKHTPCL